MLNFAAMHGYKDLADNAAFAMVDEHLDALLDKLAPNIRESGVRVLRPTRTYFNDFW